ncbi:NAD(P)H-dependent oxidoreductase [Loigolactobacillus zhaoyuanensis]|uniref:NAD(P)H-dependent oxidoreductase n=1 Tax=Loigolactobacillus zhaoyuanensis TaxID=2486017 RepID=A0ABW8UFA0_9LACO|nr:NAD(P)H-dependent oxidoreductase [Loigolactobacillus zhaoyuanensis]
MQTLIIVAHPQLAESSTQQFLRQGANLADATWRPLQAPFTLATEQAKLLSAERIIWQFPLYWYSAPAILKSWQDQVLTSEFALRQQSLAGKELGIVVTTDTKASAYQSGAAEQFTLAELLRPYQALANKLGLRWLPPFAIHQFKYQTEIQQQQLLIDYQQYLTLPQPATFEQRQQWFEQRLQQMTTRAPAMQKETLQLLGEQLATNRDNLAELRWTVEQMREDE